MIDQSLLGAAPATPMGVFQATSASWRRVNAGRRPFAWPSREREGLRPDDRRTLSAVCFTQ